MDDDGGPIRVRALDASGKVVTKFASRELAQVYKWIFRVSRYKQSGKGRVWIEREYQPAMKDRRKG